MSVDRIEAYPCPTRAPQDYRDTRTNPATENPAASAGGGSTYQVCFECGQTYATAAELLDAHNRILAADDLDPESDVERVEMCPVCVHDFVYPPPACRCGKYDQVGDCGDYMPEPCAVHDRRRSA